jgi:predicted nucleic acid-binding protein
MRAVLDTSVLISGGLRELSDELAISAVSLAEIHFGVLVAADADARARRLRLLTALERSFDPLPVDDAVAASYGELAAATVRAGRQPRTRSMDLLIAATAHAHQARLLTRNAADLRGVEHLVEVVDLGAPSPEDGHGS